VSHRKPRWAWGTSMAESTSGGSRAGNGDNQVVQLGIVGFGQIGGSIASALRARDGGGREWQVAAWSPSGDGPRRARADGVVDAAVSRFEDAVADADLLVLAAPPLACLELLDRLAGTELASGAVVTDVASTKRRIVERAGALGLPFVGGHPMAGRESSGYAAADPELFVDRPWVITGSDDEARAPGAAIERVERLATAVGARPVRMDPLDHDAAVAAVSHLPLVLSAALVEAVAGRRGRTGAGDAADPRRLAAGGWASMTRLARGDVEMGTGILATNADLVAERLRAVRAAIDEWLAVLEAENGAVDAGDLRARLATARDALAETS